MAEAASQGCGRTATLPVPAQARRARRGGGWKASGHPGVGGHSIGSTPEV